MLQCEWPKVWSTESREAVRVAIESAIRRAMAGSTNSQIRGVVNVDLPNLGSSPPELVLSGIRELSVERTALMVKLRYDGDFSVTLRGLQINLDTIGSSSEEADANLALPFYCPFEMTLHDILVDGMASIELLHELEETSGTADSSEAEGGCVRGPSSAVERQPQTRPMSTHSAANAQLLRAGHSPAAAAPRSLGSGFSSGYGVLLGAGGRRAMRPPEVLRDDAAAGSPTGAASAPSVSQPLSSSQVPSGGSGGPPGGNSSATMIASNAGNGVLPGVEPSNRTVGHDDGLPGTTAADGVRAHPSPERHSMADLATGKVVVKKRTVKLQLFGDPVKNLSVASNFASVPGANGKVEGTIKMLIKPAIDRMMTDGITVVF